MTDRGPSLRDVGEAGVLRRILPLLPPGGATVLGPGDDAAVLAAPDGRVVASTDVMVQDRDFRLDWSSAEDVGVKAAAQNLADVAAMGARPTALLVSLVAPPDTEVAWAEGLASGLALGCAASGTTVAGGDLSSGPVLMVSVTALGDLEGRDPVLRAAPGPATSWPSGARSVARPPAWPCWRPAGPRSTPTWYAPTCVRTRRCSPAAWPRSPAPPR